MFHMQLWSLYSHFLQMVAAYFQMLTRPTNWESFRFLNSMWPKDYFPSLPENLCFLLNSLCLCPYYSPHQANKEPQHHFRSFLPQTLHTCTLPEHWLLLRKVSWTFLQTPSFLALGSSSPFWLWSAIRWQSCFSSLVVLVLATLMPEPAV